MFPPVLIVCGVATTGKSTLAALLVAFVNAHRLWLRPPVSGAVFLEADDFHTPEAKASGIPMTDEYRVLWVGRLTAEIQRLGTEDPCRMVIVACSAHRPIVRNELRRACGGMMKMFWISISREVAKARARARQAATGHFFGEELIDSQFDHMVEPASDEAFTLDGTRAPGELLSDIIDTLPKETFSPANAARNWGFGAAKLVTA